MSDPLQDLLHEIEQDAKERQTPPDLLTRIVGTAEELKQLTRKRDELIEEQERIEKNIRQLQEMTLPALMDEAQVPELRLADDVRLVRTEEVYASISKVNAMDARKWFVQHGYSALVKDKVTCEFDPEDSTMADKTRRVLKAAGVEYELTSSVHAGTLKAFVRERISQGLDVPACISVHVQPVVAIKQPRKRSTK